MPSRKLPDLSQIVTPSDDDLLLIRELIAGFDRKMSVAQLADKLTAVNTTLLTITGYIVADTSFAVNSSGVNYTKTLDIGDLEANASIFNNTEYINVFLNGVVLVKSSDAIWLSNITFKLSMDVDSGDKILILS